jgi:hypothetical protein
MADEEPEQFIKTTIPLPPGHGWSCKEGNNLFVADRGAASFEIPDKWVVRHDGKHVAPTVSIHDANPPKDSCRISLTIFHLPPVEGGWGQLPLAKQLQEANAAEDPRKKKKNKKTAPRPLTPPKPLEIHTEPRPDLELIWADKGLWNDPDNGKPIHCRQLMARARLVQILITFDVYNEVREKFEPVWKDLLRTLRVAVPRDLMGNVGN